MILNYKLKLKNQQQWIIIKENIQATGTVGNTNSIVWNNKCVRRKWNTNTLV